MIRCAILLAFLFAFSASARAEHSPAVAAALAGAGENRGELEKALEHVPAGEKEGLEYLIVHMPDRDRKSLSAEFLLENVHFAYKAYRESPWREQIPREIFLNDLLPYASLNERRDNWRKDFYERFLPLVKEAATPGEAAVLLNQKIFPLLKVRYSRERPKADQSPYESIKAGTASCSGLSILLIDACRAVGVPARFVGTPLWSNRSGNHSWVEIWNDGWQFTGAAEPTGDDLNRGWFAGRAATAVADHPYHAIYAASFRNTPLKFPLVWDLRIDYVHAVNVTDRYTREKKELPAGIGHALFRVTGNDGKRTTAKLVLTSAAGEIVYSGNSKDERFDGNDHAFAEIKLGETYQLEIQRGEQLLRETIMPENHDMLFEFRLK